MKQLIPTGLDEYIAEHKIGDKVSGRVVSESVIELGEGIRGACGTGTSPSAASASDSAPASGVASAKADLSSLSSMLQARWKGNTRAVTNQPEPLEAGQIRTFKITRLDPATKAIEVELA
jgi:small subunit ribosomal protein S1